MNIASPCSLAHFLMTSSKCTKRRFFKCLHMTVRPRSFKTEPRKTDIEYCVDLVRKSDYENYIGILLLPKESQRAAFALRAFNVELAQIPDTVSEKIIGLMKLQFWKDAISRIFQSDPPHTPVAMELAGACGYYKLSKHWLERIVTARASQMERGIFTTVQSVEDFAENANSSLFYLMLECLGVKNVHADHAASHLGKALGLVTLLRATPYHATRRTVYIPTDILVKHKVSQEEIIRGNTSQRVCDAMFDIASTANHHLEKSRALLPDIPNKSYVVFLNAAVCDHYLKALQKADFNVFDGKLQRRNNLLACTMYLNKLRNRF